MDRVSRAPINLRKVMMPRKGRRADQGNEDGKIWLSV
jgi:hypothetical protein